MAVSRRSSKEKRDLPRRLGGIGKKFPSPVTKRRKKKKSVSAGPKMGSPASSQQRERRIRVLFSSLQRKEILRGCRRRRKRNRRIEKKGITDQSERERKRSRCLKL